MIIHTKRFKKRYPLKKHLRNMAMMIVGSLIVVIGFSIFITPNKLLAGGVWGLSAILHHFLPQAPMAAYLVILNTPLLIWGWSTLNTRFALYTIFTILLQSALLLVAPDYLPTYTANPLLACIFGGLLVGAGAGLVVKFHGSGGGNDIVGIILKNKYDMSVGSIALYINTVVVFFAGAIFGFEPAMYTMVELYISANVFTRVLEGANRKRNMMIVSDKGQELADKLLHEVGRGVTMMRGEGGYTHRQKDVLFCVVSRFELAAIKEAIREVDPHAFVCINETYEVMGTFPKRAYVEAALAAAQAEAEDKHQHHGHFHHKSHHKKDKTCPHAHPSFDYANDDDD